MTKGPNELNPDILNFSKMYLSNIFNVPDWRKSIQKQEVSIKQHLLHF